MLYIYLFSYLFALSPSSSSKQVQKNLKTFPSLVVTQELAKEALDLFHLKPNNQKLLGLRGIPIFNATTLSTEYLNQEIEHLFKNEKGNQFRSIMPAKTTLAFGGHCGMLLEIKQDNVASFYDTKRKCIRPSIFINELTGYGERERIEVDGKSYIKFDPPAQNNPSNFKEFYEVFHTRYDPMFKNFNIRQNQIEWTGKKKLGSEITTNSITEKEIKGIFLNDPSHPFDYLSCLLLQKELFLKTNKIFPIFFYDVTEMTLLDLSLHNLPPNLFHDVFVQVFRNYLRKSFPQDFFVSRVRSNIQNFETETIFPILWEQYCTLLANFNIFPSNQERQHYYNQLEKQSQQINQFLKTERPRRETYIEHFQKVTLPTIKNFEQRKVQASYDSNELESFSITKQLFHIPQSIVENWKEEFFEIYQECPIGQILTNNHLPETMKQKFLDSIPDYDSPSFQALSTQDWISKLTESYWRVNKEKVLPTTNSKKYPGVLINFNELNKFAEQNTTTRINQPSYALMKRINEQDDLAYYKALSHSKIDISLHHSPYNLIQKGPPLTLENGIKISLSKEEIASISHPQSEKNWNFTIRTLLFEDKRRNKSWTHYEIVPEQGRSIMSILNFQESLQAVWAFNNLLQKIPITHTPTIATVNNVGAGKASFFAVINDLFLELQEFKENNENINASQIYQGLESRICGIGHLYGIDTLPITDMSQLFSPSSAEKEAENFFSSFLEHPASLAILTTFDSTLAPSSQKNKRTKQTKLDKVHKPRTTLWTQLAHIFKKSS